MPAGATKPHATKTACPIAFAVDLIGDRWTLLVIRDLMFHGKRYYGELLASEEGIATNVLADRLLKLEENGIVTRHDDPDNRKRIRYQLTKKGKALMPALLELVRWSGKHDPKTGAPKAFLRRLEKDREGLMQELLSELKK
ncbi:MAG: helix-turn-helix transcriptional regulator [Gammaproteobacteria bacterium]|nr:helix-turn-helix transcriptional regulator [Gammaproteobacteria bacterium]